MLVFRMLCRITQSSKAHKAESVSWYLGCNAFDWGAWESSRASGARSWSPNQTSLCACEFAMHYGSAEWLKPRPTGEMGGLKWQCSANCQFFLVSFRLLCYVPAGGQWVRNADTTICKCDPFEFADPSDLWPWPIEDCHWKFHRPTDPPAVPPAVPTTHPPTVN